MSEQLIKYKKMKDDLLQLINDTCPTLDFKILRDDLQPILEAGAGEYSVEQLREFISITRELRSYIFDNIDTHILTIEHLADKELCQRAFKERSKKDTTKKPMATSTLKTPKSKVEESIDFTKMSTEQLLALLQKSQGK
jgi:hypothetical protein